MDFKFKNRAAIILALFLSILQIIVFKEIFQMGLANLVGTANSFFEFNFPAFTYYFEPVPNLSSVVMILLYFAPYIYIVLSVETASIFLKKLPQGSRRYFLVIFILIQIGYLLVHIFYSAVILILNPQLENDWIALSLYLGYGDTERFVFAFGVVFLFVFYLNMSTKRILKYINY